MSSGGPQGLDATQPAGQSVPTRAVLVPRKRHPESGARSRPEAAAIERFIEIVGAIESSG